MSGTQFSPAVDVIRPTGGAMRVSYGTARGEPAIKLESFRKAGERETSIGRVVIALDVLWPVLQAMVEAGNRVIDGSENDPDGRISVVFPAVANALTPKKAQANG